MTIMTIRTFDDRLTQRLRIQAARHGRSMEDEARDILRSNLPVEAPHNASPAESRLPRHPCRLRGRRNDAQAGWQRPGLTSNADKDKNPRIVNYR